MESKEGVGGGPEEEPPTEGVESGKGQSLRWVERYDGAGPVQALGSRTGGWFFTSRPDQSNPEPPVWTWISSSEDPVDGLGTCPPGSWQSFSPLSSAFCKWTKPNWSSASSRSSCSVLPPL